MSGIKLSPKYGVNPSMAVCFYCQEEYGIALMGKLGDGRKGEDFEAPKKVCTTLEPCNKCKEKFKNDLLLVAVDDNKQPTGKWAAVPKENVIPEYRENKLMLIEDNYFDTLFAEDGNA